MCVRYILRKEAVVIAFISGEWLDRESRAKRIELVGNKARKLAALIKANKATDYHVDDFRKATAELKKLQRVHRAEFDMLYFMYEYFSEESNADNPDNLIPKGSSYSDAAEFHRELCRLLDEITSGVINTHVAWSVGRGHAKTAYLSNGYLCHSIVYRHKRYIVEISETTDVAGDFIQWTSNQLKHNDKLREDFGELLYKRKALNETDNKYEFITTTGTKVEGKGIGTQMRGLRHGSTRPDMFLLDDLESKDNTNTPELIEKNKRWFREEMLPALSKGGICIYMGTIVAYNSLLDYVIRDRRDFTSRKFPAIISWSEREDLWQEWREVYRSDDENAAVKAKEFYELNKEEMTRGTKVLWSARFSYLDLMHLKEENGARAFNQEYLGNPIDEDIQIFKSDYINFYSELELTDRKLEYFCGVDFAMGKEKGDFSAIITIGKSPNGICYVVDAFIERVHPDILMKEIINRALKYQYTAIAVEAQQAQEWFAHMLKKALQEQGYPGFTRVHEIKQRTRKALRIESLLPDIQNSKIRFSKKHKTLLDQLELYPQTHDDGPDALHMSYSVSNKVKKVKLVTKPNFL